MKRDVHYYAVLALSRACGFQKDSAHVIAYASQFVDDAKINLIHFQSPNDKIEYDLVDQRPAFFNMATAHSYFRVSTFNYEAMVNNTTAFHFVPGCRGESFSKRLRCQEEAPIMVDILKDVLSDNDLIKLGLALHPYADTFSHQGFSGLLSKVNDIKHSRAKGKIYVGLMDRIQNQLKRFNQDKYDEFFHDIMPAYGHAQALDFPDIPYLVWSYEYDYSDEFNSLYRPVEIDNRERYQRAFNRIKDYLARYLEKHGEYRDPNLRFNAFDKLKDALLLDGSDKVREKSWQKTLLNLGLFNKHDQEILNYDDKKWLKSAFANFNPKTFDNRRVDGVQLVDDFHSTNWYRFYLSVRWYKQTFFKYSRKYGLGIPH